MPGTRESPCSTRWFQTTFGFNEGPWDFTRSKLDYDHDDHVLISMVNKQSFHVGPFETISWGRLSDRLVALGKGSEGQAADFVYKGTGGGDGGLRFKNIIAGTCDLHMAPENAGAVFQVTSLFNCLHMNGPDVRPEDGVSGYAAEATQGTACAVACPAATVFRNYFVNGSGQQGRSQIDCLGQIADLVRNSKEGMWTMRNGHCIPRPPGTKLVEMNKQISASKPFRQEVEERLQVGVHWDTQVHGAKHHVCQVFCSAPPVAFTKMLKAAEWEPLARILLRAAYKATLAIAALLAAERGQRVRVFLTSVGGGALGNRVKWITAAVKEALSTFAEAPLDVMFVHYSTAGDFAKLEEAVHGVQPLVINKSISAQVRKLGRDLDQIGEEADKELVMERKPLTLGQQIALAFSFLDSNGDGVIDRHELWDPLRTLDPDLFTEERLNRMLSHADADCDGHIHYGEFIAWLCEEDSLIMSRIVGTAAALSNVEVCGGSKGLGSPQSTKQQQTPVVYTKCHVRSDYRP